MPVPSPGGMTAVEIAAFNAGIEAALADVRGVPSSCLLVESTKEAKYDYYLPYRFAVDTRS